MKRDLFLYLLRIYFPWLQKLSSSWNSNLSSKFSISPEHKYLQLLLSAMRCHDRELILHLSQMILAYVIAMHYFSPFQPSLTHTCPYFIKYQYSCFPFYITIASRSLRVQDRGTIPLGRSSEIQQILWAQVHPLLLNDAYATCRQLAVDDPHLTVPRRVSPLLPSSSTRAIGYAL